MGFAFLSGILGPQGRGGPPPELGLFFVFIGGVVSLLAWSLAACILFAGYNLTKKRRYVFCFAVACICCILMPLGTILGVFTIVVLARPSVKELFDRGQTNTLNLEAP